MQDDRNKNLAGWTLRLEADSQPAQTLDLTEGEWTIGESASCDVRLEGAGARKVVLRLEGQGASLTWLGADGGLSSTVEMQREARWSMGRWALRLQCSEVLQPAAVTASTVPTPWRSRGASLALAATLLTTSIVAARAWNEPAPPPAAAHRPQALNAGETAFLTALLQAHALDKLQVERQPSSSAPSLRGVLATEEECQRYATLRAEYGADRFTDQVACLPEALRSASEFLSGTGVSAQIEQGQLSLSGRLADPSMRARVETALGVLRPLVPVVLELEDGFASNGLTDQIQRQIRGRVIGLHPGNPGYVLTRDGERIFEGGRLSGGLELTRVGEETLTVRQGGQDIELTL